MLRELTSRERYRRVYAHEEPDCVPVVDSPWGSTIARWRREGLPEGVDPATFFGFEQRGHIGVDNSPRYPTRVVEETETYIISTTAWGATIKNWKHSASVPDFLDFTITDRDSWAEAKERITPTEDRVDWESLARHCPRWQEVGAWVVAGGWFGYDVFASWHVGTERMLIALAEDPDWCADMINHALEVNLALLGMVWDRGYHFDCLEFPDDLGYRKGLFFSPDTYRRVVKPAHKRACDWCHDRGVKVMMHSCGNVMALLADFVDAGLDGLNPLEQKSGMDIHKLKSEYGDKLVLQGGIDVRAMTDGAKIEDEIRTKLEVLKPGGGYIYHSDHSVPDNVTFADFCRVIALVRHYGRYD